MATATEKQLLTDEQLGRHTIEALVAANEALRRELETSESTLEHIGAAVEAKLNGTDTRLAVDVLCSIDGMTYRAMKGEDRANDVTSPGDTESFRRGECHALKWAAQGLGIPGVTYRAVGKEIGRMARVVEVARAVAMPGRGTHFDSWDVDMAMLRNAIDALDAPTGTPNPTPNNTGA